MFLNRPPTPKAFQKFPKFAKCRCFVDSAGMLKDFRVEAVVCRQCMIFSLVLWREWGNGSL